MGIVGRLRRRMLTPDVSETRLAVRGFHVKSAAAQERLETVGETFVAGYAAAAEASRPPDAEETLESLPENYRGFGYEGAAMAFALRDGLPVGRRDHVATFLAGRAADHVYMAYVGVGWAMARLPRFRWPALHLADPLLCHLALDGYGFHQAYFKTRTYVYDQFQESRFPWPPGGPTDAVNEVIDQGIGRACWFVGGGAPDLVARILDRFPQHRRADLYSGAGLAATYAGGADVAELRHFRELCGPYQPNVAQGAAFAAQARLRAGLLGEHNEIATEVFCEASPAAAAKVTDEARAALPEPGGLHAFATWRQQISAAYVPSRASRVNEA